MKYNFLQYERKIKKKEKPFIRIRKARTPQEKNRWLKNLGRDEKVMELIFQGKTAKNIGKELSLNPWTVHSIVYRRSH